MDGEDLGQLRDQFLAAVLVVGGDEHDVLARQGACLALQDKARRLGMEHAGGQQGQDGKQRGRKLGEYSVHENHGVKMGGKVLGVGKHR